MRKIIFIESVWVTFLYYLRVKEENFVSFILTKHVHFCCKVNKYNNITLITGIRKIYVEGVFAEFFLLFKRERGNFSPFILAKDFCF